MRVLLAVFLLHSSGCTESPVVSQPDQGADMLSERAPCEGRTRGVDDGRSCVRHCQCASHVCDGGFCAVRSQVVYVDSLKNGCSNENSGEIDKPVCSVDQAEQAAKGRGVSMMRFAAGRYSLYWFKTAGAWKIFGPDEQGSPREGCDDPRREDGRAVLIPKAQNARIFSVNDSAELLLDQVIISGQRAQGPQAALVLECMGSAGARPRLQLRNVQLLEAGQGALRTSKCQVEITASRIACNFAVGAVSFGAETSYLMESTVFADNQAQSAPALTLDNTSLGIRSDSSIRSVRFLRNVNEQSNPGAVDCGTGKDVQLDAPEFCSNTEKGGRSWAGACQVSNGRSCQ